MGQLVRINWIKSTNDYDHSKYHIHHYIEFNAYSGNEEWYKSRGIEQKLIFMSIPLHEQLHFIAIHNMTDEEFEKHYKISRWKLIYSKKHSLKESEEKV